MEEKKEKEVGEEGTDKLMPVAEGSFPAMSVAVNMDS